MYRITFFSFALIALAILLVACSDSDPSGPAPITSNDTLRAMSDSALLHEKPLAYTFALLDGVWHDGPMVAHDPPNQFTRICADSVSQFDGGYPPNGKYIRARAFDLRILEDGRVWFDYEVYDGVKTSRRRAVRFCGRIDGDTLRGEGWVWPMSMGERNPGSATRNAKYARL